MSVITAEMPRQQTRFNAHMLKQGTTGNKKQERTKSQEKKGTFVSRIKSQRVMKVAVQLIVHPKKGRPWVASHTISAAKPTIAARPAFRRTSGLNGDACGLPLMGWLPVALSSAARRSHKQDLSAQHCTSTNTSGLMQQWHIYT
jgi:hypothetical protein